MGGWKVPTVQACKPLVLMGHSYSMSQSGVGRAKAKVNHEIDPDARIVPIQLPKRLPYRPSIPVERLRKIVNGVVDRREAEERQAALNASSE